jgi:hypothetical protein
MPRTHTFTFDEFKTRCLGILRRLGSGELDRIDAMKHDKAMAAQTPPTEATDALFGCLKNQALVPEGFDLMASPNEEHNSAR